MTMLVVGVHRVHRRRRDGPGRARPARRRRGRHAGRCPRRTSWCSPAGDAVIAFLLGLSRGRAPGRSHLRDALWSAVTYGAAIAIAAVALRAIAIPRLMGPALLTLAFYLWDAFHGASPARRRDANWIWQTLLLAALGIVVVAWNLFCADDAHRARRRRPASPLAHAAWRALRRRRSRRLRTRPDAHPGRRIV